MRGHAGFSLLELTIAMGVTLAVTGAVCSMLAPSHGAWAAAPEVADMQQRLRVAGEAIARDLIQAGAGSRAGTHTAALIGSLAPVLPFRRGGSGDDPPGAFRTDAMTLLSIPAGTAATVLRVAMTAPSSDLLVDVEPGCAAADPLCGFSAGDTALVFDDTGSFDVSAITGVESVGVSLRHQPLSKAYGAGAVVVPVAARTYSLKADRVAQTGQLMQYDGGAASNVPVVDHVVALSFEYFGDPQPPQLTRAVTDPAGPWTTYGPKPPALGVQTTAYAAGENCAFAVDPSSGLQVPRLATLGSAAAALVPLGAAHLTDGPWCPDAPSAIRFDADLLRIRRVAVTVRVQSANAALRGPAGLLFTNGGSSSGGHRLAADQEIRFDVAPRNLNLGR